MRALFLVTVGSKEISLTAVGLYQLYHDALCTLNEDLGSGMVSPPLMGSSGVVPLTIISW